MANLPGPRGRSVAEQAFVLRGAFPAAKVSLRHGRLTWVGDLQPTALGRWYTVRIEYQNGQFPTVRVISPVLQDRDGEPPPHRYSDGALCLHKRGEWNSGLRLVDTTVPWTLEWLAHYEVWLATGDWHGGGTWPPVPELVPDDPQSRSERRRARASSQ